MTARQPWRDELTRLRWLEDRGIGHLAEAWRQRAKGLRDTITGASDYCGREQLDDRAATWEQAAEELGEIIGASHVGPGAAALDWATWHADELGRLLTEAKAEIAALTRRADPGGNVLDNAGSPE
jgi:hypothetical protein